MKDEPEEEDAAILHQGCRRGTVEHWPPERGAGPAGPMHGGESYQSDGSNGSSSSVGLDVSGIVVFLEGSETAMIQRRLWQEAVDVDEAPAWAFQAAGSLLPPCPSLGCQDTNPPVTSRRLGSTVIVEVEGATKTRVGHYHRY